MRAIFGQQYCSLGAVPSAMPHGIVCARIGGLTLWSTHWDGISYLHPGGTCRVGHIVHCLGQLLQTHHSLLACEKRDHPLKATFIENRVILVLNEPSHEGFSLFLATGRGHHLEALLSERLHCSDARRLIALPCLCLDRVSVRPIIVILQ